jgi:ABC-2 type transport system permease protein
MNLYRVLLIIKREYLERVRNPGFVIGTIFGVIGIAALSFLPQLFQLLDQPSTVKVAVLDVRNLVLPHLPEEADLVPPVAPSINPQQSPVPAAGSSGKIIFSKAETEDQAALSESVRQDKLNAYVVVEGTSAADARFELHAKDRPQPSTTARIHTLLTAAIVNARLQENDISPEQAAALFAPPELEVEPLVGGELKDEAAFFQSQALVYVLLILLYGTMVMYGVQVAMGVVQEKSSRVMEVLITAVRPIELMLGKVLGIGAVGLTQYTLWVVAGFAALVVGAMLQSGGTVGGAGIELAAVPPATLVYFLVFFILGYLVYAALYAALGSLVNRTEDVNSITTPLTLLLVATYLLSFAALANPEAEYIKWLSFVPFLSPMLMFIRVALSSPAWWEPLFAIFLLNVAILVFAWLAAKIYRVGVLLYGKRPSFREIGRMIRTA